MTTTNDVTTAEITTPKTLRGRALGILAFSLKPALDAACAEIDAAPEFAGDPNGSVEARVMRKIAAYREWLVANDLPPATMFARPYPRRILFMVGHADYDPTAEVKAEIASLADLVPSGGTATAPVRPGRIDRLAEAYIAKMRKRQYGLPRNTFFAVDWAAAAEEMGCEKSEITKSVQGRLRAFDRELGKPGPIATRVQRAGNRHRANPAVGPLLAAELKRRAGGLPADPLRPAEVDLAEIAYSAGISMSDLLFSPDANVHLAAIEAARGGMPLVPNPILEERGFTFRAFKEFGRGVRKAEAKKAGVADSANAAGITVRALTQFMSMPRIGAKDGDIVPMDLPARIRRAIAANPREFGTGWAAQMRKWLVYFDGMRSTQPLPDCWTTALRVLVAEADASFNDVVAAGGSAAAGWLRGVSIPIHQSQPAVEKVEALLRVDPGTLSKRLAGEWRANWPEVGIASLGKPGVGRVLTSGIVGASPEEQKAMIEESWQTIMTQDTEVSRRLREQHKSMYTLPFDRWPEAMRTAWEKQLPDEAPDNDPRKFKVNAREPGERRAKGERYNASIAADDGWRSATAKYSKGMLGGFFGFLVRARDAVAKGTAASPDGFKDGPGLGMPVELIDPAVFAVIDLMADYKNFRRDRSGGAYSPYVAFTMRQAALFLRPGTGIVWKDPRYLASLERLAHWWDESGAELGSGTLVLDLDAFREDWQAAVQEAWEHLVDDAAELRARDPNRPMIRNPFVVIDGYLTNPAKDPLAVYMTGVRQMLASKPLSAIDRHLHRRNSVLTLILVQTALRAGTLLLTVSGPDPTLRREVDDDGNVTWRITIPANKFKNYYSPYFAKGTPYEFELDDEDDLYRLLDEYVAVSRPYLLAGKRSDALFVTKNGNAYTAVKLGNTYRNMTGVFFAWNEKAKTGIKGVKRHGLHAVRHIVASSLLRTTGDIYLAAWAIQDTAKTVERHYGHFLPRDKVRIAVEHLRKSRARPLPANDRGAPRRKAA